MKNKSENVKDWIEKRNSQGNLFFFNKVSKASSWVNPKASNNSLPPAPGFVLYTDNETGHEYYFNEKSGESYWNSNSSSLDHAITSTINKRKVSFAPNNQHTPSHYYSHNNDTFPLYPPNTTNNIKSDTSAPTNTGLTVPSAFDSETSFQAMLSTPSGQHALALETQVLEREFEEKKIRIHELEYQEAESIFGEIWEDLLKFAAYIPGWVRGWIGGGELGYDLEDGVNKDRDLEDGDGHVDSDSDSYDDSDTSESDDDDSDNSDTSDSDHDSDHDSDK